MAEETPMARARRWATRMVDMYMRLGEGKRDEDEVEFVEVLGR